VNVFAYCVVSACNSVRRATGVTPITSPPVTVETFQPSWMEGYDLLYFRLHGIPGGDLWFGEDQDGRISPALTRGQIAQADLTGAIVVVANCYGAETEMAREFYRSRASIVIAGYGKNYAASNRVLGTDLMVRWIIRVLKLGLSARRALTVAKARLVTTAWRASDRDALGFHVLDKEMIT